MCPFASDFNLLQLFLHKRVLHLSPLLSVIAPSTTYTYTIPVSHFPSLCWQTLSTYTVLQFYELTFIFRGNSCCKIPTITPGRDRGFTTWEPGRKQQTFDKLPEIIFRVRRTFRIMRSPPIEKLGTDTLCYKTGFIERSIRLLLFT